jgi:uncharacterized membrane protein YhaH (DUF805 family)
MTAVNPYAPPKAAVADVYQASSETQPVRVWSGRGRVGRLRYLANLMGGYFLVVAAAFGVGALMGASGMDKAAGAAGVLIGGAYLVFVVLKSIQRSHDMDWSGWTALLALIPLVGLVWIFKAGTEGNNRFGAPAPANTLGVKLLALAIPLIGLVGILAAVLLPILARR